MLTETLAESLKDQDEKLLVAQILGEVGAKEIGLAAHTNQITQPQQLALHAALGATISTSLGGDALSGAIAGASSEYIASEALKNGTSAQNAILLGQGVGAASSLISSSIQGRDDEQIAKDINLGAFVGVNAAVNNALYLGGKIRIPAPGPDYDLHAGVSGDMTFTSVSMGTDGMGRAGNAVPVIGGGIYVNLVPHGENVQTTISYGGKDQKSYNLLRTYEGGTGVGFSYGYAYSTVKYNVTVDVPTNKVPVPKFFSE